MFNRFESIYLTNIEQLYCSGFTGAQFSKKGERPYTNSIQVYKDKFNGGQCYEKGSKM